MSLHAYPRLCPTSLETDQILMQYAFFYLKIAQDRGLKFYQAGGFAIVLENTKPTEAFVKSGEIEQKQFGSTFFR